MIRSRLNALSTGALVMTGMALVVAALAAVALFSYRSFTVLNDAFADASFAALATNALHADVEDLLEARTAMANYRATFDPAFIDAVAENVTDIMENSPTLALRGRDPALDAATEEIRAAVARYNDAFLAWRTANQSVDANLAVINEIGPRLSEDLGILRSEAFQAGNVGGAYQAGVTQEKILHGRFYATQFYMRGAPEDAEKPLTNFRSAIQQAQVLMMKGGSAEGRETSVAVMDEVAVLITELEEMVTALSERTEIFDTQLEPLGDAAQELAETDLDRISGNSDVLQSETNTLFEQIAISLPVLVAGSLALAGAFAAVILAAIRRRFDNLVKTTEGLAKGDIETEIANTQYKHEVGRMSRALEVFRDGEIERAAQAERERLRMEETAMVVDMISSALERVSRGDLRTRITADVAPEFAALKDNFNRSVQELEATLASVVASTDDINIGMESVARASEDLSVRTEQQASALAEVTATVVTMETDIKETEAGSNQAMELVRSAHDQASRGKEVMARSVSAMERIKKSSEEIGRIIGVIDDIAFQTNLLALNAGVESARAGEAGRGFAVVATEVQALAQRTGEAAGDVKRLIENSANEVSEGSRLADDTSGALSDIAETVDAVNAAVSQIANTAQEQTSRVQEISKSMTELDMLTQQNAAMVEETSAETMQLKSDVGKMRNAAEVFQIGHVMHEVAAPEISNFEDEPTAADHSGTEIIAWDQAV